MFRHPKIFFGLLEMIGAVHISTDLAETLTSHQFEDLHFIVDHQTVLSKLLSGQAQPVNAAKYGASYRATWRMLCELHLGVQEGLSKASCKNQRCQG